MESLGSILTRIKNKRQTLSVGSAYFEQNPQLPPAPTCQVCQGSGWVRRESHPGDPDFGQAFPCRCQHDTDRAQERRAKYAELPAGEPKTFDNFTRRPGVEAALDAARSFARHDTANTILSLVGWHGNGKTHLLEAIGREMLLQGLTAKYCYVPDLLDKLRSSYNPDAPATFEDVFAGLGLARAEVLLLDDLTEKGVTDWAIDKITRLVNDRYRNGGLLALATNLAEDKFARVWGERLADRVFDRHTGIVQVVAVTAPSYRTGHTWAGGVRHD